MPNGCLHLTDVDVGDGTTSRDRFILSLWCCLPSHMSKLHSSLLPFPVPSLVHGSSESFALLSGVLSSLTELHLSRGDTESYPFGPPPPWTRCDLLRTIATLAPNLKLLTPHQELSRTTTQVRFNIAQRQAMSEDEQQNVCLIDVCFAFIRYSCLLIVGYT